VDYAAALRDAKRAVRAQARWAHPYYWAPFVLTGAR
jgi:CHAT domain-containing protein